MIGFNKPYLTGKEIEYIADAHRRGQLAGDGHYTKLCSRWIEKTTGCCKALLTHSCTAALEMAALLADIQPGDEIIMPSYTFVSTANAFVLRGGVSIFVDIREDTLNINEELIESAITPNTKAIVPVHYAGVGCNMERIMAIARKHGLLVIEDAAQGVMATYRGRSLGSIGDMGCFSFHETKNIISGEGGALLINNPEFAHRAEIIREKGTNRSDYSRGLVDKYTWVDLGSSFLPGELIAAFLWAQMEDADAITAKRMELWSQYATALISGETRLGLRTPVIPPDCRQNAHMFYLLLESESIRNQFISLMQAEGVNCVFHYVPLHTSGLVQKLWPGTAPARLSVTERVASSIVRLPLWIGADVDYVIGAIERVVKPGFLMSGFS